MLLLDRSYETLKILGTDENDTRVIIYGHQVSFYIYKIYNFFHKIVLCSGVRCL